MASNWATHLIGADEEVQKKVHEELDSIFGRGTPQLLSTFYNPLLH